MKRLGTPAARRGVNVLQRRADNPALSSFFSAKCGGEPRARPVGGGLRPSAGRQRNNRCGNPQNMVRSGSAVSPR
jgi:hypothetical protein